MADEILTHARLLEVVHYEPTTGVFTRLVRLAQRHQVGDRADFPITGGRLVGYRRVSIDSKRYMAHRVAWFYVHGQWPSEGIDHRNGEKGDNRIDNLRDVPDAINRQNMRRAYKNNKSGYQGVYAYQGRWMASLTIDGVRVFRASFDDPQEAHVAYLEAKRKHHSGCTI